MVVKLCCSFVVVVVRSECAGEKGAGQKECRGEIHGAALVKERINEGVYQPEQTRSNLNMEHRKKSRAARRTMFVAASKRMKKRECSGRHGGGDAGKVRDSLASGV